VRALDTNVIVRFLLNDDKAQGRRARRLLQDAETFGDRLVITAPVVLETIWVLSAVYDFTRDETLRALELLLQMPVLEFNDYDSMQQLVRLGRSTRADLSDLLIGLASRARGCEVTVTFEKGLADTGLFERL
jgi:predicted nucleic-acid-binding protein